MIKRTCTEINPAGVTSFNIERWAKLPSWGKLVAVLNDMTTESRKAGIEGDQDDFAAVVDHLAHALFFSDCCSDCGGDWPETVTAPCAIDIDGSWVTGKYLCVSGHRWTCGWSITAPSDI